MLYNMKAIEIVIRVAYCFEWWLLNEIVILLNRKCKMWYNCDLRPCLKYSPWRFPYIYLTFYLQKYYWPCCVFKAEKQCLRPFSLWDKPFLRWHVKLIERECSRAFFDVLRSVLIFDILNNFLSFWR